jgi:hypothetical protein
VAHLWVPVAWVKVVGRGVVGEGVEAAARVHGGGVAPAGEGRNERAGELHGFEMQLARWSRGLESVWSGGSTVKQSSPEMGRRAAM